MDILSPPQRPAWKSLSDCICSDDHLGLVLDNIDPAGETDCWLWTLKPDAHGYGVKQHKRLAYKAHRFVYEALVERIPEGLTLDHLCRVPMCVNPDHLEPVTYEVNVARMHKAYGHLPLSEFPANDPRHGTLGGYTNMHCRCEACRRANTVAAAEYRRRVGRRRYGKRAA